MVADEEEVFKEEQAFMPGCNLIQTMMGIIHHVDIMMTCTPIIILVDVMNPSKPQELLTLITDGNLTT